MFGITTGTTYHGDLGKRETLPSNTLIRVERTTNLPPDSSFYYWAHPVAGVPWPVDTSIREAYAGVGLHKDDVRIITMTTQEIKEYLPDVIVRRPNGTTVYSRVRGRKNNFASVSVPMNPGWFTFEWSWESIARSITQDKPLRL